MPGKQTGTIIPKWHKAMWTPRPSDEYKKRDKWYQKKRPREWEAVLTNLARYIEALNAGTPPKQIQGGWIHPEKMDVVALSQQGGTKNAGNLQETRLYVYPDVPEKIVHLITLGDKNSQAKDVLLSRDFVVKLRERTSEEDEEEEVS